jgi:hypothetical protein
MDSYPKSRRLGMKLFCLISTDLAQQTVFQLLGSLIGYMSPLALRVILAHVGPAGSKHGDTGGEIHPFNIANRFSHRIQINDFPQLYDCIVIYLSIYIVYNLIYTFLYCFYFMLQVILISMLEQL